MPPAKKPPMPGGFRTKSGPISPVPPKPAKPKKEKPARRCSVCQQILSRYNPDSQKEKGDARCFSHQRDRRFVGMEMTGTRPMY